MKNENTAPVNERETLMIRTLWLNIKVFALAAGFICGLGVFVATNWLIIKGGEPVGPHLRLLGQFFIGYRVTFMGSLIGSAYGFITGWACGIAVGWIYNRIALARHGKG